MTQPAPDALAVKFQDGTVGKLPREQAMASVRAGHSQPASAEEYQQAHEQYLQDNATLGDQAAAMTFGGIRGAGAALGLPTDKLAVDTAALLGGQSAAEKTRHVIQSVSEKAPIASKVGEFGGMAVPGFLGDDAGLGAAAESAGESAAAKLGIKGESFLGRVGQKAIPQTFRGAAEGAQLGITDAANEDSIENQPLTGEQLFAAGLRGGAAGAALGGILGTAGEVTGTAGRTLKEAMGNPDMGLSGKLANFAEDQGARALFHSSDQATMRKLEALPGGTRGAARQLLDDGVYAPGDTVEHLAPKVASKKEELGAKLGDMLDNADKAGAAGPSATSIVKEIKRRILPEFERAPSLYGPEIGRVQELVADIAATGAKSATPHLEMTFGDAQKFRRLIDQKIKDFAPMPGAPPNTMQNMLKQVRGIIEDHTEQAMDAAGEKFGRSIGQEYRDAKLAFRRYATADTALEKAVTRVNANRNFKPTSYLAGAAMVSHYGVGGAVAAGLHEVVRERGNATAAYYAHKLSRMQAIQRTSATVADDVTTGLRKFFAGEAKASEIPRLTDKKIAQIQAHLSNSQDVQQGLQSHLGELADHAPKVAQQVALTHVRAVSYLAAKLPKPVPSANTLQPQLAKKRYTAADVAKFQRVHQVVSDPSSIPRLLGSGQLTLDHVQALKAVYPAIYTEIQTLVHQKVAESKRPYSYSQRLALSLLFGEPLDATMNPQFIQDIQASYAANPAPQNPGAKAPKRPLKLTGARVAGDKPEG